MALWREEESPSPLETLPHTFKKATRTLWSKVLGKGWQKQKGWEHVWVSTKLHFELICHSPGFQILCIFSSPCFFKARKEGRARKFYKEWKHINDSCEQLLIFLTYNFLITVNQNNLHDNIFPTPPPSVFKSHKIVIKESVWSIIGKFNSLILSGLMGLWHWIFFRIITSNTMGKMSFPVKQTALKRARGHFL